MSRIGRAPIEIPNGVNVSIADNVIKVVGSVGTLERTIDKAVEVAIIEEDGKKFLHLTRNSDDKEIRSKHGLFRALAFNMIEGATKGYEKTLVINGVGYKAQISGGKIIFNIGFSHPIEFIIPKEIKAECPSLTEVKIFGADKEQVGQVAANIRSLKPVEPYHAYGIRYKDEVVRRKEGKKASKKK